ncbi:MAG TPA: hypothetical protein ENK57_14325, partial [Polyangiaceae bacterium]|nr:hypothetical protein [Polyangiaceae bacterium]
MGSRPPHLPRRPRLRPRRLGRRRRAPEHPAHVGRARSRTEHRHPRLRQRRLRERELRPVQAHPRVRLPRQRIGRRVRDRRGRQRSPRRRAVSLPARAAHVGRHQLEPPHPRLSRQRGRRGDVLRAGLRRRRDLLRPTLTTPPDCDMLRRSPLLRPSARAWGTWRKPALVLRRSLGKSGRLLTRGKKPAARSLAARLLAASLLTLAPTLTTACHERPAKVPGETDIAVSEVNLQSHDGSDLTPSYGPLMDRLGMRPKSLVLPPRYYSPFRVHEDQRRIEAFWQNFGFFDVDVRDPELVFDKDDEGHESVAVTWTIEEGPRYRMGQVVLKHAPDEHAEALHDLIITEEGATEIDIESFRLQRRKMAEHLRRAGYGHARVYSRVFLDKDEKLVHFFYYADAGPKTKVKSLVVEGNHKLPAEVVIERAGLEVGRDFSWMDRYDGEFHLLDTGAIASTFIRSDVDTKFYVPGDQDDGGAISDEQIDADGNLIPRELPEAVDVKIHVVEAPSQQLRVRAGGEVDPS